MKYLYEARSGFMLASVLVLSFSIIAIMVALLMVTTSSFKGSFSTHYQKLSDEAAEAGSAYATACLSLSAHAQTWGSASSKPSLSPNTDCSGTNSYPGNKYVYSDSTVRTYFVVGDLDYSAPFSAQISAKGYAEILKSDGSVEKTYQSIQKKIITWPTDTESQMSASGTNRTCAIVNYQVYCWGCNAYGQLGDGRYIGSPNDLEGSSSVDSKVPIKVRQDAGVMAGKKMKKVFVAQYHTCALSTDGLMYCWGYNGSGQLGNGTATDSPVPIQVKGNLNGETITDIGGTNNSSCAIAGGKIYCWGTNANGLTGRGVTSGSTIAPALVSATGTSTTLPASYVATKLSTSGSRSQLMCAIVNSKAYCWGQNNAGSVGDGTTVNRAVPTKVDDTGVLNGKAVTAISQDGYLNDSSGGFAHVCAVASAKVYCWGENTDGQLGNGLYARSNIPVAVSTGGVLNGKTVQDVQVGLRHSCVRADSGAYCWGLNNNGQVGDGTSTTRDTPVAVAKEAGVLTASNVQSIGAGSNRGCAVTTDGRSFCWGLNASGQVGDGTKINRHVPTESLFLRPIGNQYIF